MKNRLMFPLIFVALMGVACGGDGARRGEQKSYETVQEGSAAGVTSTLHGPGEVLPPITGTNSDTTTAFTIDPNAVGTAPAPLPPNAVAGATPTMPPAMTSPPTQQPAYPPPQTSGSSTPPPSPPVYVPPPPVTPRPVTPQPAPPTDTAPPTQTDTNNPPTPPPPPPEEEEEEEEEEPPPPPPTQTDTRGPEAAPSPLSPHAGRGSG